MAEQDFTPKELESEEWRPVPGLRGDYEVSNLGRVKSNKHKAPKILHRTTRVRYLAVHLCMDGISFVRSVHYLVALTFIGPRPLGHEINHKDTHKFNNRADNLEYLTKAEHLKHTKANGLYLRGDNHPARLRPAYLLRGVQHGMSKLTDDAVRAIRQDNRTYGEIAKEYGVHRTLIGYIRRRAIWKHVS